MIVSVPGEQTLFFSQQTDVRNTKEGDEIRVRYIDITKRRKLWNRFGRHMLLSTDGMKII